MRDEKGEPRYRIGEAAEILGLTKEGVRYLEKRGLIASERDPGNGYRYYTRGDLAKMQQLRTYEKMGLTIAEAADLFRVSSTRELEERLGRQKEVLEEEIARLRARQSVLERQIEVVRQADEDERLHLQVMPAAWFLPTDGADYDRKMCISAKEERTWIREMPYTLLAKFSCSREGGVQEKHGIYVEERIARKLGTPLPERAIYLPERLCAVCTVRRIVREQLTYAEIYARIAGEYRIAGEMLVTVQMPVDLGGRRGHLNQVAVPVEEKGAGEEKGH